MLIRAFEPDHLLGCLADAADGRWARVRRGVILTGGVLRSALVVDARVRVPGRSERAFALEVFLRGEPPEVAVRESPGRRLLPARCPELHIDRDSVFCLGVHPRLASLEPLVNQHWWAQLYGFLHLQLEAEYTRVWPSAHAMAHGPAAVVQLELESVLDSLPQRARDLATSQRALAGECPCGARDRIEKCHGGQIERVRALTGKMQQMERDFLSKWPTPCCGRVRACNLPRLIING